MEPEPLSNMGLICPECSDERHKEWQERNKNTLVLLGDYCKIKFTDGDKNEHMFVRIFKATHGGRQDMQQQFTGWLYNDPHYVKNVRFGDEIEFLFNQIEAIYRNGVLI